jgi:hypothetical protein
MAASRGKSPIYDERYQVCGTDLLSIEEKMKYGPRVNIVRRIMEQKAKEELQICIST